MNPFERHHYEGVASEQVCNVCGGPFITHTHIEARECREAFIKGYVAAALTFNDRVEVGAVKKVALDVAKLHGY